MTQRIESALIKRINRRLASEDEQLRKSRSLRMELACGRFFIVGRQSNLILYKDVDIEELGRELGVLNFCEAMAPHEPARGAHNA